MPMCMGAAVHISMHACMGNMICRGWLCRCMNKPALSYRHAALSYQHAALSYQHAAILSIRKPVLLSSCVLPSSLGPTPYKLSPVLGTSYCADCRQPLSSCSNSSSRFRR